MSDNAVVIAAASTKGGCGKSTTILILAGEYAAQGYRVHIVDADPRKRLLKWAGLEPLPEKPTTRPDGYLSPASSIPQAITATATNMRAEIEKARSLADVVLIDVEGTANASLTLAVAYANLVIIPATISPPDVEDGLATIKLVQDMAHASRRNIPHGFLWSNVLPAIRSREMVNLEGQVDQAGISVIARIFQRTAFSSLFSFQTTLDQLPPSEVSGLDKAKADAIRLTDAIERLMKPDANSTAEAAA